MLMEWSQSFSLGVEHFEIDCARRVRQASGRSEVVLLSDSMAANATVPAGWVNRALKDDSLNAASGDVFDRLTTERLHPNPATIVVLFGRDDMRRGTMSVDGLIDLYGHLLSQLGYLHPKSHKVVVSIPGGSGVSSQLNVAIGEFNGKLRDLAESRGVTFWDLSQQVAGHSVGAKLDEPLSRSDLAELFAFLEREHSSTGSAVDRASAQSPINVDTSKLGYDLLTSYGRECWSSRLGSSTDDEVVQHFIVPEIDYLLRYIETGAQTFCDLYVGSRAKFIAANESKWKDLPGGVTALAAKDSGLWIDSLTRQGLNAKVIERVARAHEEIAPYFELPVPAPVKLLFIGDCLLEDVELMIGADLLRQGMLADIDPIVSKNPAEQTREIRARAGTKYAGIVYSPLSWEFDMDFRKAFEMTPQSTSSIDQDIEHMTSRIEARVRLLADLFECNIFIHNTAAVVRASSEAKRKLRSVATRYKRERIRSRVTGFLNGLVQEINAASFEHLYIVDEAAAVRDVHDDVSLGRFLYYMPAIHPAELSVVVARQISQYVSATVRLSGKKVIVCDLDNTLWDGVIGEGLGVRHCRDRQRILRELKARGIVLAICSKNDPANVKFVDAVLSAEDFVASEVSWGPKPAGVARMAESLNLKAKDFIFIDDRSDERAMMMESFPKLTALDPCDESTWTMFRTWTRLLNTSVGADRTEMYKQRAEREKLLASRTDEEDAAEAFGRLALKLDIRKSSDSDLKRIHELINRTNQWNLQGSRCTFAEVKEWHESPDYRIYSARVKDKFGDMGLISVCVAQFKDGALEVQIFVLSCRVFGYGVETVMLRELEKDAIDRFGERKVRGFFVPTAHNGPSKDFFVRHGYLEREGAWVSTDSRGEAPEPNWFVKIKIEK
jgi:FkbH-like protein